MNDTVNANKLPFIQWPFFFDVNLLRKDLNALSAFTYQKHINQRAYDGIWTSIDLLPSINDTFSSENIIPTNPLALKSCEYIPKILDSLSFTKQKVRIMNLKAGSSIKPRKEAGLSYQHGVFRIHIPIETNAAVRFLFNGEKVVMKPGACWYADFTLSHEVYNEGDTDRVYLMIIGERNDWTDNIMLKSGYVF